MNANRPPYPEACPQCNAASGWPYAAGTCEKPGVILVKLRCNRCGREWTGEAPKAPMSTVTLWPRADRRKPSTPRRVVH